MKNKMKTNLLVIVFLIVFGNVSIADNKEKGEKVTIEVVNVKKDTVSVDKNQYEARVESKRLVDNYVANFNKKLSEKLEKENRK